MKAIIGLGNMLKSDDNIANLVLDRLNQKNKVLIKAGTNPENFISKIKDAEKVVFIDAVDFGGKVGEVRLFDLNEIQNTLTTTHNIPISMIQKFFPEKRIKIIGIQPKKIEHGTELSDEIKKRFKEIVSETQRIIDSL